MSHQMTVITDKNGTFLGAVRYGTVQHGKDTLESSMSPHQNHTHQTVEVDDDAMKKPFAEVRDMLLSKISKKS